MKGFLYTIAIIIILAIIAVIMLGRDGTDPSQNTQQNTPDTTENGSVDTNMGTTTDNTATSTDETATTTSPVRTNDSEESTSNGTSDTTDTETSTEADVVIELTGENFAFSQKNITVQKGDRVRIEFTSTDGFHDWVVDEFDAATDRVQTGDTTSVEFVADTAGEFEYYCSVGSHRELGMVGTLIVEE